LTPGDEDKITEIIMNLKEEILKQEVSNKWITENKHEIEDMLM